MLGLRLRFVVMAANELKRRMQSPAPAAKPAWSSQKFVVAIAVEEVECDRPESPGLLSRALRGGGAKETHGVGYEEA